MIKSFRDLEEIKEYYFDKFSLHVNNCIVEKEYDNGDIIATVSLDNSTADKVFITDKKE